MSLEKIAGRDLGRFMASQVVQIDPLHANHYLGACDVYEDNFRKKAHKQVMSKVYSIFEELGEQETKCAIHIKALSNFDRDHSDHVKSASDMVFDTLTSTTKSAAATGLLSNLSDTTLALLGGGTALLGAGGGALYWGAKREANEEDAKLESKRQRIKYYRNLVNELKEKSRRDYSL